MDVKVISSSMFDEEVNNSDKPVLVEFFGSWCMPCKMLSGILDKVAIELANKAKVVKLDVDENKELAAKFGVMTVPTMFVFKNGEQLDKAVGFRQQKQIVDMITPYL